MTQQQAAAHEQDIEAAVRSAVSFILTQGPFSTPAMALREAMLCFKASRKGGSE